MVFFYSENDSNGNITFETMPQLWYFLAITVGLTVLVFLSWMVWQRLAARKSNSSRRAADSGGRFSKAQPTGLSNVDDTQLQVLAPPPESSLGQVPFRGRRFHHTSLL